MRLRFLIATVTALVAILSANERAFSQTGPKGRDTVASESANPSGSAREAKADSGADSGAGMEEPIASGDGLAIRVQVRREKAPVYEAPEAGSVVRSRLRKGRKLVVQGEPRGGFYRLATKSGQALYIRASDVRALGAGADVSDDLVSGENVSGGGGRESEGLGEFSKWRATFDLGVSSGTVGERRYAEGNLGLNLYFRRWIAFRNALFGRFSSGFDTLYGVDSSVRGIYNQDLGPIGDITVFVGPGWRFVNEGRNAPFVEGGLVFRLFGIAIGGGGKRIYNKAIDKRAVDDSQFFIILSGGGGL